MFKLNFFIQLHGQQGSPLPGLRIWIYLHRIMTCRMTCSLLFSAVLLHLIWFQLTDVLKWDTTKMAQMLCDECDMTCYSTLVIFLNWIIELLLTCALSQGNRPIILNSNWTAFNFQYLRNTRSCWIIFHLAQNLDQTSLL